MTFATAAIATAHLQRIIARGQREKKSHRSVLYFIGGDDGPVKIGHTTNLARRFATIQAHSPIALRVLATLSGQGHQLEVVYHHRFAHCRLHGEWFERTSELIAEIERLQSPA